MFTGKTLLQKASGKEFSFAALFESHAVNNLGLYIANIEKFHNVDKYTWAPAGMGNGGTCPPPWKCEAYFLFSICSQFTGKGSILDKTKVIHLSSHDRNCKWKIQFTSQVAQQVKNVLKFGLLML